MTGAAGLGAALPDSLRKLQRRTRVLGPAGLAVCAAALLFDRDQFFRSYLIGFLLCLGWSLGSMAILMIHHLAGGSWGFVSRRVLEAATRTLPLLTILFLPIPLGLAFQWSHIYPWADGAEAARGEVLRHNSAYLNVPFFLWRAVFYFAVWLALSGLLNRWSSEQDRTGDAALQTRLRYLSAPGILLYALTVTFAAIDWAMSLEPEWFSTIYGVMFIVGQAVGAMALAICVLSRLVEAAPLRSALGPAQSNDLGNFQLAFVMLWAYVSLSQFLIIWSANIPEEIHWYLSRTTSGWQGLAVFLTVFHFAVPFLFLISRPLKRDLRRLSRVALLLLLLRVADLYWLVAPAFGGHGAGGRPEAGTEHAGFSMTWLDVLLPASLAALWLAQFLKEIEKRPLLPLHDPRFEPAMEAHAKGGHA